MSSHSSDQLHTPATSPSTPTQPLSNPIFDRAIQDHLKLLDDSERRDFIASTPDDVRNVAAGYHAGHGQSRFLLCVQRVSRVIAPLEQFFSAVDNGVSSNPVLAGIVWGALRFVMQAIRGVSAHLGKIGNVLEEIAEALPHYQDYAVILFSNSQRVMEGLAGVYGDILLTCTTIRRIYMRAQGKRRTFSVAIRFLNPSSFDDIVSRLRQRREHLNERVRHQEMMIAHEQRRSDVDAQRLRDEKDRERERKREEEVQQRSREEAEARERDRLRQLDQRKSNFLALLEKSAYAECHSKHEACRNVLSQRLDAGRWLLDRPDFQNWADSSSGMLWLRGKAGAGKTILASIVVKHLGLQFDGAPKQSNVAYFYCQYDDVQKRSYPRVVLGTLLHQVISQLPSENPHMPEFGSSGASPPDHDALLAMLSSVAKNSKSVVLVVDALDEFDDNSRRKLLQALKRLSRDSKVFFTSRDLMPSQVQDDTQDLLRDVQVIPADPEYVNRDISKFVDRNVRFYGEDNSDTLDDQDSPLKVKSLALRDDIRRVLVERAEGMFLYARLQLLHLRKQSTEHDVQTALHSLPYGINKIFLRALQDIEALPQKRRERVRRLLRWLVCSSEPPLLDNIADAVVVDDMDDDWDASRCMTQRHILIEDSANLVEARYWPWSVQFVHASIKEFLCSQYSPHNEGPLEAYHFYPLSAANVPLVLTAIKYHSLTRDPAFKSYSLTTKQSGGMLPISEEEWTPTKWSAELWFTHLRAAGKDGVSLMSHFRQILDPARSNWRQQYDKLPWLPLDDPNLPLHHIAVALNLYHIVTELVGHRHTPKAGVIGLEDINERNQYGQTSLHVAAVGLFEDFWDDPVLRLLLDNGADVDALDLEGRTALHIASEKFYGSHLVQPLLEHGANVDARDGQGRTALHYAIKTTDSDEEVKILLEHGADINAADQKGQTALHIASNTDNEWHGSNSKVKILLDHGADVNTTDKDERTALHIISGCYTRTERDNWNIIETLLEHGADVHATDRDGRTPLLVVFNSWGPAWFGLSGRPRLSHALTILLEHGADMRATDSQGRTALHIASGLSDRGVQALNISLEHGVDVHATDREGRTPLHIASETYESSQILEVLLKHGADVHGTDTEGRTPLHVASSCCTDLDVMKTLLEHGADVHSTDGSGRTPLHLASELLHYSPTALELLLEHGADVRATDENGWTPLFLASTHNGSLNVLLQHGADVHNTDKKGRTPLHIPRGDASRVTILLEHGADVDARDHEGNTALLSVLSFGAGTEDVLPLLQHGAKGDVVNCAGKTALHIITEYRNFWTQYRWEDLDLEHLLHELLAHGADPQATDALGKRAVDHPHYQEQLKLALRPPSEEEWSSSSEPVASIAARCDVLLGGPGTAVGSCNAEDDVLEDAEVEER